MTLRDNEFDKLLSSAHLPEPEYGFEQRLINGATAQKQQRPYRLLDSLTEGFENLLAPRMRWQVSGALAALLVMVASGHYLLPDQNRSADSSASGDVYDVSYTLDDEDDFLDV